MHFRYNSKTCNKMGNQKTKVLIDLKDQDLKELIRNTHFTEKEIKTMYKRYWCYCSADGMVSKEQFGNMFSEASNRGKAIVDHIFRTTDRDDSMSLGKSGLIRSFWTYSGVVAVLL